MNGFYIDTDLAIRRGLLGKVKVFINGKLCKHAIRAKSGKNGFVEFFNCPFKVIRDNVKTTKCRGVVKISIDKREQ